MSIFSRPRLPLVDTMSSSLFRKLLSEAHRAQMTSLKSRLETETKELRSTQTKKSMEDVKTIQTVRLAPLSVFLVEEDDEKEG